jgi:phage-related protein
MKSIIWHPKAKEAISAFPEAVRKELGYLIFQLQLGQNLGMPHSSPMKTIAQGVYELRVRGDDGIYRSFYYTKHTVGILLFHAFKKKTQKTPSEEILLGKKRLNELLEDN